MTDTTNSVIASSIEVLDAVRADLRACRAQTTIFRRYEIHRADLVKPMGSFVEIVGGGCLVFWSDDSIAGTHRIELFRSIAEFINSSAYRHLRLRLVDSGDSLLLRDRLANPMHRPMRSPEELSEVEQQLLRLIAAGCSNKEIGAEMTLAESTVKNRLSVIYAKLHVLDRTQAAIRAHDMRLLPGFGPDEMDDTPVQPV